MKKTIIIVSAVVLAIAIIVGSIFIFTGDDSANKPKCTITYNTMGGEEIEPQTVVKGTAVTNIVYPQREGYAFVGWYLDKNYNEIFDLSKPITKSVTLYARWVDTNDKTDTDGDGLTNPFEEYYTTDASLADTDGDGLNDYVEIVIIKYNALKKDTDGDGILDGEEDCDGDGIDNLTELDLGTDLCLKDTDGDKLDDKKEIDKYTTDPINKDTDGDGVSDGKEIELGTDPLEAQSSFEITQTVDKKGDKVKPTVEIELSGEQVETLSISPINNDTLFPKTIPGYMGKAYDFNVKGDFSSAKISFEFENKSLNSDLDPVIYYYNENAQKLEELETTVNGNVATATVTHFSTYILIDRAVFQKSFKWIDVWESNTNYTDVEVVLVIDDSGSMTDNDSRNQRLDVAKVLIDKLPDNSKIGVVKFESSTTKLTQEITTKKRTARQFLTTEHFKSSGGTNMYSAIDTALGMFKSNSATTLKMLVVLSDGNAYDTNLHESMISIANQTHVKIFTVGLGNSTRYFTDYLKPLAINTGGSFYLASKAEELADIYKNISEKIDITTDGDDDGIPDYYEDNMICFNGVKLKLDKTKEDTDGDGLKDGEEVILTYEYNEDKTRVLVTGEFKLGNPTKNDSDGDLINDASDPSPFIYTITDRTLAMVEGMSYTNLEKYIGKTIGEIKDKVTFKNLKNEYVKAFKDAEIIYSNNSANDFGSDFWDGGLGTLALRIARPGQRDAIIIAFRGTEPTNDLIHDGITDIELGLSWDCNQSRYAFSEYKAISSIPNAEFYTTGHSLGGRIVLDVLYKTYKSNENVPTPVHTATFNALGYNGVVYATLKNDILARYKNKLNNFYYWQDQIGEGFGVTGVYTRPGKNIELLCKNKKGETYRTDKEFSHIVYLRDWKYHGIKYFHDDYDLIYDNYEKYPYWYD